ncbi:MAG: winged helix-turn-helix transcriptional regulator [Burkholderiales bacterium]|nr:winged helix-turn-helix transcriptional regulator [Burkholderiales bacterium]
MSRGLHTNGRSVQVLRLLASGLRTTAELADVMGLASRELASTLNNLCNGGYVTSEPSPETAARRIYHLSPRGRGMLLPRVGDQATQALPSMRLRADERKRLQARAAVLSDMRPRPQPVRRDGSLDFLACPTRIGDLLYYRDGRVVAVGEGT